MAQDKRDRVGQQLGNYRLLCLLGRGGFAGVYLGEHVYLGSPAALKVLHTLHTDEDRAVFVREAQTLVRLTHSHIVRVLDFAIEADTPFLVMEYAPHGTLRQWHPTGTRLSPETIVSYVQQVASALQYAHDQRLVHRDVKPENMLFGSRYEVLLSDFGLAVLAPHSQQYSTQNLAHQVVGTSPYLAPEQLQGQARLASDQYALGVVVYEWLCGHPPFVGTPLEVAVQHLSMSPPSLREQLRDLAPAIEDVVLRALAKEPQERFASVQEFVEALSRACQPPLVSPAPAASSVRPRIGNPEPLWKVPTVFRPLLGREQEVAALGALLRRREVRLVTLLGTGGIGKTSLALQVTSSLRAHFGDGACFVHLAAISDPDLVVPTLAQELGIQEVGKQGLFAQVQVALGDRHLLLVLDNFEQLTAAAPLVEELRLACPALTILVTSRAVLHLPMEHQFPLAPLALPDLRQLPASAALSQYAAVALFVERAQAVLPTFQVTETNARSLAELCVRLDGLPLALELAAARVKLLPPQALLARLSQRFLVLTGGARTLPTRQQTLRNTLQWSYDLLDAGEQQLFRRLSVFVGGWTLSAVEALCADLQEGSFFVLDAVASLLDKSLLLPVAQEGEEPRLQMLMTVREYGLDCLRERGEAEAVHRSHADYYLALAEETEPHLKGAEQLIWLAQLEREQENLRAALGWHLEHGEGERALRLGGVLWWFWYLHGDWSEGRRWLEAALQLPSAQGRTAARAMALCGAGELARFQGELPTVQRLLSESVTLSRELGDEQGLACSLGTLGVVLQEQGELAAGRSLVEEGLTLCRRLGRTWHLTRLLLDAGKAAMGQRDLPQAAALGQEGLTLARELGDKFLLARGLSHLGIIAFQWGDETQGVVLTQESLTLARELGDKSNIAYGLNNLGYTALQQGDLAQAAALTQEGLTLMRELGDKFGLNSTLHTLGEIAHAQGDERQAAALYKEAFSLAQELGDKEIVGYSLIGLARVAEAQGQPVRAARLLGAADTQMDINTLLTPVEHVAYEREVATVRAQLGEEAFAAASAQGRMMTPEQALAAPEHARAPKAVPAVPPTALVKPPTAPAGLSSVPQSRKASASPDGLTAREVEVLRLVAQALTNEQVAERLVISPRTVDTHLTSIYSKIGVSSRSGATRYAMEHHLV